MAYFLRFNYLLSVQLLPCVFIYTYFSADFTEISKFVAPDNKYTKAIKHTIKSAMVKYILS
jgi:hypothetical protein